MNNEILDEELLLAIEEENPDALEELINRYSKIINVVINKYKQKGESLGLDLKDLYQEGLIGLIKAVKTYKQEKGSSFKTYANIIIEREILDTIKANDRMKYKTLNNAISLDNCLFEEDNNLYSYITDNKRDIDSKLIDEEEEEELKKSLTNFELKVFELKMDGKTNTEISLILDKPIRSIENTIQRIKIKIKERI